MQVISPRRWLVAGALALAGASVTARSAIAQTTVACDFDVADNLGRFMYGNTIHLNGLAGSGTNQGTFFIINGNNIASDVDLDGFAAPGACNYTALFISAKGNLVNVANPSLAINGANITVTKFPSALASGQRAEVNVSVELPAGTVSGTYRGFIEIRDNNIGATFNAVGDILNRDLVYVEVVVGEQRQLTGVSADSAGPLDSLTLRGRAGTRAAGVFRLANTGNVQLSDVRLSSSDLRSESAVGLVIPAENITFGPPSITSLATSDTARVTVEVRIPGGILGGRYRGSITAQGAGATAINIPLVVIVTSSAGILFTDNPVRASQTEVARISFNGDPGTGFTLGIFTMDGRVVYKTSGTVFAGVNGTSATPTAGADFAATVPWSLRNGVGERVASGMYLVIVQSTVNGRRQSAQNRLMVIR